jgi:hypothetical protein
MLGIISLSGVACKNKSWVHNNYNLRPLKVTITETICSYLLDKKK